MTDVYHAKPVAFSQGGQEADEALLRQTPLGRLVLASRGQQQDPATFSSAPPARQDPKQSDDERTAHLLALTPLGRQALEARPQEPASFAATKAQTPDQELNDLVDAELVRVHARRDDQKARAHAIVKVLRDPRNAGLKRRLEAKINGLSAPGRSAS